MRVATRLMAWIISSTWRKIDIVDEGTGFAEASINKGIIVQYMEASLQNSPKEARLVTQRVCRKIGEH